MKLVSVLQGFVQFYLSVHYVLTLLLKIYQCYVFRLCLANLFRTWIELFIVQPLLNQSNLL